MNASTGNFNLTERHLGDSQFNERRRAERRRADRHLADRRQTQRDDWALDDRAFIAGAISTEKKWDSDTSALDDSVQFFFRIPLFGRVGLWMFSAWLTALPFEWFLTNYNWERCLHLLHGYLWLGLILTVLRSLSMARKPRLGARIRSGTVLGPWGNVNQKIQQFIGITLWR